MMEENHKITSENEKKTLIVIAITIVTMVAEIIFGYTTHSMALLADGFHTGVHALAFGLALTAYVLARKFSNSEYFPNGTDKIETLSAYTSSLFLGFAGIFIIIEAFTRLLHPLQIQFGEAILVATIGLIVNILCIFVMEAKHSHHEAEHQDNKKSDYNFKAAYYHILADALTSVLAIIALIIGKYFNIIYLDSLTGILGGILIIKWAVGLIKNTVAVLIDMKTDTL